MGTNQTRGKVTDYCKQLFQMISLSLEPQPQLWQSHVIQSVSHLSPAGILSHSLFSLIPQHVCYLCAEQMYQTEFVTYWVSFLFFHLPVRVLLQLRITEFWVCPVHQVNSAGHSQCLESIRIPSACSECVWQVSTAADAVWKCQTCCTSTCNPFWVETWILSITPSLLGNATGRD